MLIKAVPEAVPFYTMWIYVKTFIEQLQVFGGPLKEIKDIFIKMGKIVEV